MPYVIEKKVGQFKYWLQIGGMNIWNGLRDNATKFEKKGHADELRKIHFPYDPTVTTKEITL